MVFEEATLEAWNLTATKHVCLTTDNGANIRSKGCQRPWLGTIGLFWIQPSSSDYQVS